MRPGHEAPENVERRSLAVGEWLASMRPGHEAPENERPSGWAWWMTLASLRPGHEAPENKLEVLVGAINGRSLQ